MAFSNIENSEKLDIINIAIVDNKDFENNEIFKETFKSLSDENNEDRLFDTKYVTEEKAKVDDIKINEYKSRQKGESWKYKLEKDIDLCMKKSNNKFEFFKEMNSLGYKVTWTKERKNITFTTPDGKKCRDRKLHNVKYLKDNMEKYFLEKEIINKNKVKNFETTKRYYSDSITRNLIYLFKEKNDEYIKALYSTNREYGTNAKKEYARKMSYSSEEIEM